MTFSDQFIKIMDAIVDKLGIVIDWTSKNVIPYIQNLLERFIKYETYTSIAWLVLGAIILVLCIIALIAAFREDVNTYVVDSFVLCILAIVGIIMIIGQTIDIIEVNTIPEKTIMEFIDYHTDIDF